MLSTFALVVTLANGQSYVADYGLSETDCNEMPFALTYTMHSYDTQDGAFSDTLMVLTEGVDYTLSCELEGREHG